MNTIIEISTIEELKELYSRVVLSRTDEVTKVSDGSVLSGTAYGAAKLQQKGLKDIALSQSHFYPDTAYGQYLDNCALMYGIAPRFGSLGSSTYVRLVGLAGTVYVAGTQVFSTNSGISFTLASNVTIGADGFDYGLLSSNSVGLNTAVDALTITKVAPIPIGHQYVINEYKAVGGRDIESDETFRERIKNNINSFSRGTIEYLTQIFQKINPNVLRVLNYGTDGLGSIKLGVASQDGSNFSTLQLDSLLQDASQYLSLADLNPDGLGNVGVVLQNITWEPIDISFRVELLAGFNADNVRKDIQTRMEKIIDYRYWKSGERFIWVDFFEVVQQQVEGVKYVPDNQFFPGADFFTDYSKLPRIRGFLMLDLDGNIISNGSNSLNPVFYPNNPDFSFSATVLASL